MGLEKIVCHYMILSLMFQNYNAFSKKNKSKGDVSW
jgi:hypothetical protein